MACGLRVLAAVLALSVLASPALAARHLRNTPGTNASAVGPGQVATTKAGTPAATNLNLTTAGPSQGTTTDAGQVAATKVGAPTATNQNLSVVSPGQGTATDAGAAIAAPQDPKVVAPKAGAKYGVRQTPK
jgi:hypothetical protein